MNSMVYIFHWLKVFFDYCDPTPLRQIKTDSQRPGLSGI